jgi:hypothetical protein
MAQFVEGLHDLTYDEGMDEGAYGCLGCSCAVAALVGIASLIILSMRGDTQNAIGIAIVTVAQLAFAGYCLYGAFSAKKPDEATSQEPGERDDPPSR